MKKVFGLLNSIKKREKEFSDVMIENNVKIVVDLYAGSTFGKILKVTDKAVSESRNVKRYFVSYEFRNNRISKIII